MTGALLKVAFDHWNVETFAATFARHQEQL